MKIVKKISIWILCFLFIPIIYLIVSLVLTAITIDSEWNKGNLSRSIYLSTNGVHLDIVIPIEDVDTALLSGIKYSVDEKYVSFGWGDKNFYVNTPTWGDLTFSTGFKAMFWKSSTLMHVTRYKRKQADWIEIKVHTTELQKLNTYIMNTFQIDKNGLKTILENKGYSSVDDFYTAKGSYSCFKTCNSWVNTGFKESGLKSCLWTPFDFGLLHKYQ